MNRTEILQKEIESDLDVLDNMGKYLYILSLGKELPAMNVQDKTEENLVKDCHSAVWMTKRWKNGVLSLSPDSDTLIVRGLLDILYQLANGRTRQEVKSITIFEREDLKFFFPGSRGCGFSAILRSL